MAKAEFLNGAEAATALASAVVGRGKGLFQPLRISVVIPHLNQPVLLARCLASLKAGNRQPDEIIVVDNGSRELPHAVCAAETGVRLLQDRTPGPGPARNTGVNASQGEILAFIDADCLADPAWLQEAEAAMRDPAVTILGGDVRIAAADASRLSSVEAYESIYAYRMDRYITRENFTGTGNLVVRRSVIDKVGPFAGLAVAEDRDWGQRATALGFSIRYVPGMRVYHPARENISELEVKWDRHIAHEYVEVCAKPRGLLRFVVKTLAMTPSILTELPRILASDRISGAGNRWRACTGLARIRLHRARRMVWLAMGGDPALLFGAWNRG